MYNPSSTPVDAGGLYLTDDPEMPTQWQIPTGNRSITTIPAWGFLLVWADGDTKDSGLHTSFKLDSDGDTLYLFDTDGRTVLDSVEFGRQTVNISYGRYPDATGDWQFLMFPTPAMGNTPAYQGVVSDPAFSHEHGFYEEPIEVTISCATPDAMIYYTTDGSEPFQQGGRAPTGGVYTQPIRIAQTTCLRAIAVRLGWGSSRMQTQTYLFAANVPMQSPRPSGFPTDWKGVAADYAMSSNIVSNPQYGPQLPAALLSLPSMSIVMNVRDLFDTQTGIYSNPQSSGVAWERPCSVELINPDGTPGFQINCGVRIRVAAFRSPSASAPSIPFACCSKGSTGRRGSAIRCSGIARPRSSRRSSCGPGPTTAMPGAATNRMPRIRGTSSCAISSGPRATPPRTAGSCISTSTACTGDSTIRSSGRTRPSPAVTMVEKRKTGTRSSTRASTSFKATERR